MQERQKIKMAVDLKSKSFENVFSVGIILKRKFRNRKTFTATRFILGLSHYLTKIKRSNFFRKLFFGRNRFRIFQNIF